MAKLTWESVKEICSEKHLKSIKYKKIINEFGVGKSCQEILGISDELMEAFASIADEYLLNQEYKEASDCFFFLATLSPFESEYWLRLGNAEHALGNLEDSLHAYYLAMWTNADDPYPHLYSAQVYYFIEDDEKADRCVEISLFLLDDAPELEAARPILEELKEQIQKRKK